MAMTIDVDDLGGARSVSVVSLDGELDASNYERLIEVVRDAYARGTRGLVLDMSKLSFMASSGLFALHSAFRIMRGETPPDPEAGWGALHEMAQDHDAEAGNVRIAGPQEAIARVLERTGMGRLFPIDADRDAAVAALQGAWPTTSDADLIERQLQVDQVIERELQVAQRIQRTLVLLAGVEADGWEIASDYRPARSIGGDFFDVFPLLDEARPRHLGVVIADVSGKGIAAALLMAFVRPVLRSALDRSGNPVEALERTNHILVDERRTGLFVTVLCGVLDLDGGVFTFANGGHELPLLAGPDGAEPRWVEGGGPLLGVFGRLDLVAERVEIRPGERLVLYTDGITDAASPDGERYGDKRFVRTVADSCLGGSAADTTNGVIQSVLDFQGAATQADDLALLVFRRLPA